MLIHSMRPWLKAMLALSLLISSSSGCALLKPLVSSPPVVIPDSREIKEIPGKPGWYEISGGHLQELYEQQRILLEKLEQCQANPPKATP